MSDHNLRVAQIHVLSRTLAHLSHDVQNHLAIINESAGWMKDLMKFKSKQRLGRIGSFFKGGKQRAALEPYMKVIDDIETYVNKASVITQALSRFAHGLERNRSVFNADSVLKEIQDVLMNQAGDKGISMELKLAGDSLMIETDPSGFQLALFEYVEQTIKTMERGNLLTLESGVLEGQYQVRLSRPCPGGRGGTRTNDEDEHDLNWYIIENLGGQIQKRFVDDKCVTIISFAIMSSDERD
jgi:hypothetical protein